MNGWSFTGSYTGNSAFLKIARGTSGPNFVLENTFHGLCKSFARAYAFAQWLDTANHETCVTTLKAGYQVISCYLKQRRYN